MISALIRGIYDGLWDAGYCYDGIYCSQSGRLMLKICIWAVKNPYFMPKSLHCQEKTG